MCTWCVVCARGMGGCTRWIGQGWCVPSKGSWYGGASVWGAGASPHPRPNPYPVCTARVRAGKRRDGCRRLHSAGPDAHQVVRSRSGRTVVRSLFLSLSLSFSLSFSLPTPSRTPRPPCSSYATLPLPLALSLTHARTLSSSSSSLCLSLSLSLSLSFHPISPSLFAASRIPIRAAHTHTHTHVYISAPERCSRVQLQRDS